MGRTGTKQFKPHEADQIVQQMSVDGGLSGLLGDNYHLSPQFTRQFKCFFPFFLWKVKKGYHHTHAPQLIVLKPFGWLVYREREWLSQRCCANLQFHGWPKVHLTGAFFQIVFNKWGKTKDVGYIIRENLFLKHVGKKFPLNNTTAHFFGHLLHLVIQGSEPIGQSISTMVWFVYSEIVVNNHWQQLECFFWCVTSAFVQWVIKGAMTEKMLINNWPP